jgi:hypothetical protein
VARMGEERNLYRVLVGKPEGKSPLGRPTYRWEFGIRIAPREIGWGVWSVVNAVMNLRVLAPPSYDYYCCCCYTRVRLCPYGTAASNGPIVQLSLCPPQIP